MESENLKPCCVMCGVEYKENGNVLQPHRTSKHYAMNTLTNKTESEKKRSMPMTTSEPTTGELIEALRCDGVIKPCEGCFFAFQIENCSAMGCRTDDMFGLAADRLESQERTIAEKDANIAELTEKLRKATGGTRT